MNLLRHRLLNGWPLFYLLNVLTLIILGMGVIGAGPSSPAAVESLVSRAGQIAAPLIYLAFVASPMARLYPSAASQWTVANRRYIGLSFAAVFTWHTLILIALYALYSEYYLENVHEASDVYLGTLSYLLLMGMSISSFYAVRRRMRVREWRFLHRVGIWYFWFAVWATYTELALANSDDSLALLYAVVGTAVFVLRVWAYIAVRIAGSAKLS